MMKTFSYLTCCVLRDEISLPDYISVFSLYFSHFCFDDVLLYLVRKTHDYISIVDYTPYDYQVTS